MSPVSPVPTSDLSSDLAGSLEAQTHLVLRACLKCGPRLFQPSNAGPFLMLQRFTGPLKAEFAKEENFLTIRTKRPLLPLPGLQASPHGKALPLLTSTALRHRALSFPPPLHLLAPSSLIWGSCPRSTHQVLSMRLCFKWTQTKTNAGSISEILIIKKSTRKYESSFFFETSLQSYFCALTGFGLLSGKESIYQCRRHEFNPWVRRIPSRRKGQPTPVFLPGESHGHGAWWATVHGVPKESGTT